MNPTPNYFKLIQQHFDRGSGVSTGWVVMAAGLILSLIAALALAHWWRTRRQRPAPTLTFLAVASRLGLGAADQWLLIRIALRQKLPSPITLLLSADTLRHHAQACGARMSRRRSAKLMRRVEDLAGRLFASPQGAMA